MKSSLKLFVPALLILLFTYATLSKVMELSLFRAQLYLQPFPNGFADLLVFAVPLTEVIAIVLLCVDRTRFARLILSVGMLAVFTGYISFLLFFRDGRLPCSCGGILNNMSWTAHIVFNCAFIAAGLAGIIMHKQKAAITPIGVSS